MDFRRQADFKFTIPIANVGHGQDGSGPSLATPSGLRIEALLIGQTPSRLSHPLSRLSPALASPIMHRPVRRPLLLTF